MSKRITRRDFVNGVAIAVGTGLLTPSQVLGQASGATDSLVPNRYYPPTLTGMRGSHEGSFEVAHALAWNGEKPESYQAIEEHYDLIVVGAGMSGLAAAHYFRKKVGVEARILVLDNHDDFGGHAKRNEFHHNGKMILSLGGAQNIDGPSRFSDVATELLRDIGIDQNFLDRMLEQTPADYRLGGRGSAASAMALPGPDGHVTVNGDWAKLLQGEGDFKGAIAALPISVPEQEKLVEFIDGAHDYLDELSLTEKWEYINSVSYNEYLVDRVNFGEETLPLLNCFIRVTGGVPGWNLSVLEAIYSGAPGIKSMGWVAKMLGSLSAGSGFDEIRMFPDGNASIARLLVQKLIPEVAPSMNGVEDVAIAEFDYSALDLEASPTRIRLNSTVVGVREIPESRVEVDYVQNGNAIRTTADRCILACNNGIIPHLCPEMSEEQKEGLRYGVKIPFVYANVLLRNGKAFQRLKTTMVQCPDDPFQWVCAAPTMSISGYEPPQTEDEPMAVFMMSSPVPLSQKGQNGRDLLRFSRHLIYSTTFDTYERDIRAQLQSLLGVHGFNHEKDIEAITVNRLPHGYAYFYLSLDDPEWPEGQAPHEIGRAKFGRISIANADSEAIPYMHVAWDAAWRAVEEQTA